MYTKIVVGTDLSETSKVAIEHAATLASKVGAELVLVHAGSDPGPALKELGDSVGAEIVVSQGNPPEVLLNEAERLGADLLVVGSVGMSGARRFALGNVPNKISHHADRDLLIVKTEGRKGGGRHDYRKILVGADGSLTAMRAVEMASRLAKTLGTVPTIVTVYETPAQLDQMRAGPEADAISAWHATREQRETPSKYQWRIAGAAQAEDVLERAAQHAGKFDVEPELRAVEGAAAEQLLEIAEKEGFDLICVGGVGMSGAARFTLGNVPHRLSHHSPTDILILKTVE